VTSHQAPRKRKYSSSRPSLDFPELVVARVELSSKGKLVYLRMEKSATDVWFKVELDHWVMDDTKAKENLLRQMNGVTGERDPTEKLGTELKLGESQFTLKTIIKVLGISERHVQRLYRGKVSFEKTRKIQLENKSDDYGEEPEYEIMDGIEDIQDCEDEEESVMRRIVIVEDMEELREKEHQEQEAEERQKQEVKEHQEQEAEERQKQEAKEHQEQEAKEHQEQEAKEQRVQEAKERQEQEAKERRELEAKEQREQEAKERVEQEAKERDQTAKEQQETDEYRAKKLLKRGGMSLFPPGRHQWGETGSHFVKSNQYVLAAKILEGIHPNRG